MNDINEIVAFVVAKAHVPPFGNVLLEAVYVAPFPGDPSLIPLMKTTRFSNSYFRTGNCDR
jgi:glycine/D-amino acid oxidase-like deaminating enzyme